MRFIAELCVFLTSEKGRIATYLMFFCKLSNYLIQSHKHAAYDVDLESIVNGGYDEKFVIDINIFQRDFL